MFRISLVMLFFKAFFFFFFGNSWVLDHLWPCTVLFQCLFDRGTSPSLFACVARTEAS